MSTLSHGRVLTHTEEGNPVNWFVERQVETGKWVPEELPPDVTGLPRPHTVYWQEKGPSAPITFKWHGDKDTFCPPRWWDAVTMSGSCGYACRYPCFLVLTHRIRRDPMAPVLYRNTGRVVKAIADWLLATSYNVSDGDNGTKAVKLSHDHVMGLAVDRGDSLLYEEVLQYAPRLFPLFAGPETNPQGRKLLLLTKSANIHLLAGLPTQNVVVSFSLNPDAVADAVEGRYVDGVRITPPIARRLVAMRQAQDMGFEVRARIDPITPIKGWREHYANLFLVMAAMGLRPTVITLGTYREKNSQLEAWALRWGLPAADWRPRPDQLERAGTHMHLKAEIRQGLYAQVAYSIKQAWSDKWMPQIGLCKETHTMRRQCGVGVRCNCLA